MTKLEIPQQQRHRLDTLGRRHGYSSSETFAAHLVDRGLRQYATAPEASLPERLEFVAEDQGYSSVNELVEHLLERGLRAYESPSADPEKLHTRLRGLGYID